MSNLMKSLLVAGAVSVSAVAQAEIFDRFCPYAGADFKQAWVKGNSNYSRLFAKSYPGMDAYLGAKFHENFGVELGYNWSFKKSKSVSMASSDSLFGARANNLQITSRTRIYGPSADLVGFLPVLDKELELFASLGVGMYKPKVSITTTGAVANTNVLSNALTSLNGKTKTIARVGLGAQYLFSEWVGVRVKGLWEGTSRLRVKGDTNLNTLAAAGTPMSHKPFRSSFALVVGGFVNF